MPRIATVAVLTLGLSGLALSDVAEAGPGHVQVLRSRARPVKVGPPIAWKDLELFDPKTKKPVKPTDTLTLKGGHKMLAKDYFSAWEKAEKLANQQGASLRQKGAKVVLERYTNGESFEAQAGAHKARLRPVSAQGKSLLQKLPKTQKLDAQPIPAGDPSHAAPWQTIDRGYAFAREVGDDYLGARLDSDVSFRSSKGKKSSQQGLVLNGTAFGQAVQIATVSSKAESTGTSASLDTSVSVLGSQKPSKQASGNGTLAKTLMWTDTLPVTPLPITLSYDFIVCSADLTVKADLKYGATSSIVGGAGTGLGHAVSPLAKLVLTTELSAGCLGFDVGVGGSFELVNDTLTASVKLTENTADAQKPQLDYECAAENDLSALAGDLYAFVRAPWGSEARFELASWKGVQLGSWALWDRSGTLRHDRADSGDPVPLKKYLASAVSTHQVDTDDAAKWNRTLEGTIGKLTQARLPGQVPVYLCHTNLQVVFTGEAYLAGLSEFGSVDPACNGHFVDGILGFAYTATKPGTKQVRTCQKPIEPIKFTKSVDVIVTDAATCPAGYSSFGSSYYVLKP
ncbi:MAG: hypothetical protein U0263_33295 [Polyangiaceae bacterium]